MNKQKKQLFILLGVLIFFIAAYFGLQAYNNAEANKEEEAEGETVISMEYSDVEYLQFTYEGEAIHFECVDGTWYVEGDHSRNVKQYRVKSMLSGIACPLLAEDTIENVTDLSLYGLAEPANEIIVGNDVEQYTIYVGDYNSMTSNYYAYIATDPTTVYSIGSVEVNRFDYGLEDLLEAVTEETTEESTSEESTAEEITTGDSSAEEGTTEDSTVEEGTTEDNTAEGSADTTGATE